MEGFVDADADADAVAIVACLVVGVVCGILIEGCVLNPFMACRSFPAILGFWYIDEA